MKFKKISLLVCIMSMSYMSCASGEGSEKKLVEDPQRIINGLVYSGIAASVLAPLGGLVKGCERRTLKSMERSVVSQFSCNSQHETFQTMYVDQKMDTRLYTTATGPLTGAIIAGVAMRNPRGLGLACCGLLGNVVALSLADRAQRFNAHRYEKAVTAVNLERSLQGLHQINGDAGLSYTQKIFCMGKNNE